MVAASSTALVPIDLQNTLCHRARSRSVAAFFGTDLDEAANEASLAAMDRFHGIVVTLGELASKLTGGR